MLRMPDRNGWYIEWVEGYREIKTRSGSVVKRPILQDFTSQSLEEVALKKAELEALDIEVKGPFECIF